MAEQKPVEVNVPLAQRATECGHEVRVKLGADGAELWHYGDPLLRDGPLVAKEGRTDTGAAIVLLKRFHKQDDEERRRREKLHV